jgi:hypothetical protein
VGVLTVAVPLAGKHRESVVSAHAALVVKRNAFIAT